jgi:hypothetical protein
MSSKTSTSLTRTLPLAAALWACLAGSVIAQEPEDELERFRADLMAYVNGMEALPYSMLEAFQADPRELPAAREEIQSMSPEDLQRIREGLDLVPFWRSLPRILATATAHEEYFSPLELAAQLDPGQILRSVQRSPQELEELVARLAELPERLPSDALPPDYPQRVADLGARLHSLRPIEVGILRQKINSRAPVWQDKIQSTKQAVAVSGGGAKVAAADKDQCDPTSTACGSLDFPDDILCEIDNIIDEIAAIPCRVGEFAVTAGNFIIDQLEALLTIVLDLLPSTDDIADALLSVLSTDLSDPTWAGKVFQSVADKVRLPHGPDRAVDNDVVIPCPVSFGDAAPDFVDTVSIPVLDFLIGDFGTQVAANRCARRFHFLTDAIGQIWGDDTLSKIEKIAFVAIPIIVKYLCNCYDAASAINFDDNQQVHRELVASRFCKPDVDDDDCERWIRFEVVNGRIDLNLDGLINAGDIGPAKAITVDNNGVERNKAFVTIGELDLNNDGSPDSDDDGTFAGYPVQNGKLDLDGDGNYGESNGDDDGVVGDTLIDDYFIKISDLAERDGAGCLADTGDEATWECIVGKVGESSTDPGSIRDQVDGLDDGVAGLNLDLDDLDTDVAAVSQTLAASVENSGTLSAEIEAFRDLALQLRIESDLVRDGDQRIGLFQLPASVCSDSDPEVCGLIEVTAAILTEAIVNRQAAGRDLGDAVFYLERGNNLYQEGSYKKAYTEYRNAYRELVLTRN